MIKCLGVFREVTNSPNREQDDTLILKAVAQELEKLDVKTSLIEPKDIDFVKPEQYNIILPMCENYPALMRMRSWGKSSVLINNVESVFNCYRVNMISLLNKYSELYPATEMRFLKNIPGNMPSFLGLNGVWIKRGDVHNTCERDVVFVNNWEQSKKVKEDFQKREIAQVVIQEHIQGDLIKFYGIGPFKWFNWFYHKPDSCTKYPFSVRTLEYYSGRIAEAIGLEIYGGDAIVTPRGRIYIIDINSWPSFAKVRNEAKQHIAKHVFERAVRESSYEARNIAKESSF